MQPSTRYIPKNSTAHSPDFVNAIVYAYDNASGQPCAMAYRGKSNKPVWNYRFKSPGERYSKITDFLAQCKEIDERHAAYRAERAAAKKAFRHSFQPGDILYTSWGYDQTNVEFFQVIRTSEKQVTFREIAKDHVPGSDGFMCSSVIARPGEFLQDAKEYTRTVGKGGHDDTKGTVSFSEHPGGYCRTLWAWDGKPHYCSWYA